jgi:hypothetical protein
MQKLKSSMLSTQASRTTRLLVVLLFIVLFGLATAMAATGHALPAGRIFP